MLNHSVGEKFVTGSTAFMLSEVPTPRTSEGVKHALIVKTGNMVPNVT